MLRQSPVRKRKVALLRRTMLECTLQSVRMRSVWQPSAVYDASRDYGGREQALALAESSWWQAVSHASFLQPAHATKEYCERNSA